MNDEFDLLKSQFNDNIINWYPYKEGIKYRIVRSLRKDNKDELENICRNLVDNESVLIMADNKLAIKNICQNNLDIENLYNRRELEELLDNLGLCYRKFYYPLPDCNFTNVIFTDNFLPDKESINRNIVFYNENDFKKNEANVEYKKLIEQDPNLFKIFANSFFIECSSKAFEDNCIEFVSFSNMRKAEYRIKTVIKGDKVYKQAENSSATGHIENIKNNIDILNKLDLHILDSYDDKQIISEYVRDGKTLDKVLCDFAKTEKLDYAKRIVYDLFVALKEKLQKSEEKKNVFDRYNIDYNFEDIKNLNFVKYGFWDLIFQNTFFINDKYFFYDQEWLEKDIPIEFLIYRSFKYSFELQKNFPVDEIYQWFGITTKNLELFEKLDNILQINNRSELSWKLNFPMMSEEILKTRIEVLEKDKEKISEDCKNLLLEKDSIIVFLKENLENTNNLLKQKNDEINLIKNSKSWKMMEPLRRFKRKMDKN